MLGIEKCAGVTDRSNAGCQCLCQWASGVMNNTCVGVSDKQPSLFTEIILNVFVPLHQVMYDVI